MLKSGLPFEAPRRLRAFVRATGISIIALAAIVGVLAGLGVAAMGAAVNFLHQHFLGIPAGERLSAVEAVEAIEPMRALVPALGGLVLGLGTMLVQRFRPEPPV